MSGNTSEKAEEGKKKGGKGLLIGILAVVLAGGGGAGASGSFDASCTEELFEGGDEVAAGSADGGVQASCASILHGGSFIEIAKYLCR